MYFLKNNFWAQKYIVFLENHNIFLETVCLLGIFNK